jgi:tetratricopeptide (TPR) repeat protein
MTQIDPTNAEAWISLGGLYAEVDRMEDSRKAYEKVVEIDPSAAYQTFYNIGVLLENKDKPTPEDRKRAIQAYEKAVEIKPDYAAAWKRLGFARLGDGDRDGTRTALQKYIELQPDASDAAQVRAMLKSLGG